MTWLFLQFFSCALGDFLITLYFLLKVCKTYTLDNQTLPNYRLCFEFQQKFWALSSFGLYWKISTKTLSDLLTNTESQTVTIRI